MEAQKNLLIRYVSIADLKPYANNARTHSKHQIRQIANSIRTFGFVVPILIDRHRRIIAGHARVEAARSLGIVDIPAICLEDLTEDQVRALVIADNKLAENAGWDLEILSIEFQALLEIDSSMFDITVTGFEKPEIDSILQDAKDKDAGDDIPETDEANPITKPGDTWRLGKHLVHCGNSLHESAFRSVLRNRRADSAFTDPPYNLQIGLAIGKGRIHHREFSMASGELSEAEFVSFLCGLIRNLVLFTAGNSVHYICMDWRHVSELLSASKQFYSCLLNICVWVKDMLR